jgi:hypothetical protein
VARRAASSVTPVFWLIAIAVLIFVYSPTLDVAD